MKCKTGKKIHYTRERAIVTLKRLNNKALNSYKCPVCHFWHLGNSNQDYRRQQRIDQLLGIK
jgi:uncharacterized protein YlaI